MEHFIDEYFAVVQAFRAYGQRSTVLRLTFEHAISFFQDGHFDLVYIDGYAHTGQEGGETIEAWYQKVAPGGMLAGHDECMGEVTERSGKRKVRFYGMSSRTAMDKHAGGVANYRASEGKEVLLDYRGPVEGTVLEILGGVRSACTYVGAHKLRELSKRTTFIRVARQLNEVFGQS